MFTNGIPVLAIVSGNIWSFRAFMYFAVSVEHKAIAPHGETHGATPRRQ